MSAFSEAYDQRRMERERCTSWRTRSAQAVDKAVDDLSPACPRCNDLLPTGSVYCAECGVRVIVSSYDGARRLNHDATTVGETRGRPPESCLEPSQTEESSPAVDAKVGGALHP